jgi:adenylyltransferase/sulfurtransferase
VDPIVTINTPEPLLPVDLIERSARSITLPGFGRTGQRRLAASRVLVIGAGGLGSPALQYLAASGVGLIGIVDFDTVDLSNLQRQVIHGSSSVGELKTTSAARTIAALNPSVTTVEHPVALTSANALELFAGYDVIVDGSDNFPTRYLANDAAAMLGKPYVWGSVLRYDGQVTVFWEGAPDDRSIDYRDLHPTPPAPGDVLSCADAGVLATVCGAIGTMMATEVIKLIVGIGDPLLGRVLILDALAADWRQLTVRRSPARIPVTELIDYDEFCGVPGPVLEITADELKARDEQGDVIDVREAWERGGGYIEGDRHVPLTALLADLEQAGPGPVVVYCASGIRSAQAVAVLREHGIDAVSLRGGYTAWRMTD